MNLDKYQAPVTTNKIEFCIKRTETVNNLRPVYDYISSSVINSRFNLKNAYSISHCFAFCQSLIAIFPAATRKSLNRPQISDFPEQIYNVHSFIS